MAARRRDATSTAGVARSLRLAWALLASAALALPGQAQVPEDRFELQLGDAATPTPIPHDGTPGASEVPWTLRCRVGAPAPESATGTAWMAFTAVTPAGFAFANATAPVQFPDCVTAARSEGTAHLAIQAPATAPGETGIPVALRATIPGLAGSAVAGEGTADVRVAWNSAFNATTPMPQGAAGPQKQLAFPIRLESRGNAPALVHFALAADPPEGWQPVVPHPVVLVPGEALQVPFVVATPHHNGPNSGDATFDLRVSTASARDPALETAPMTLTFHAIVRGWYIPGPPLWLVALGVLGAALVRRRA